MEAKKITKEDIFIRPMTMDDYEEVFDNRLCNHGTYLWYPYRYNQ